MLQLRASSPQQGRNESSGTTSAGNGANGGTSRGKSAATKFAGVVIEDSRAAQWRTEESLDEALGKEWE